VKEEDKQNEELLELSNQILELTGQSTHSRAPAQRRRRRRVREAWKARFMTIGYGTLSFG
jgi:hypothetical protein